MRQGIKVEENDKGMLVARVPGDIAWNLVEYLSNQRVHVLYSFEESRVVVRFDHINKTAATNLLDNWMRAEEREEAFRARTLKESLPARTPMHA